MPSQSSLASGQSDRPLIKHLSIPAILCTACTSFPFAAETAGSFAILIVYGWHAYFVQGLRLTNWKKGTLSTGGVLASPWMFLTGVFTVAAMVLSLYVANELTGRLRLFLGKRPVRLTIVARLVGAAALFLLWYWIYIYKSVPFMHPSSVSPLIGSIVLAVKGLRAPLTRQAGPG